MKTSFPSAKALKIFIWLTVSAFKLYLSQISFTTDTSERDWSVICSLYFSPFLYAGATFACFQSDGTVNREILVMVLFWSILAPKYEVPKLSTPKYVTLQKLTAKIEHCLNIFLYLYSLICTFLSYFFPK